ncbi:hypothetical protein RIR_e36600_A0A2N1NAU7_9GLOM [Rhizophagus irregularis DAOM 181602=DAOM 197198]|uniref:Uncharacterized protein n=2 Tax=Rhizophagus irregularis TaxID=588596 RepID=A0A2N1NAU7_9GLOM|nr:hypothetical protein RhiirC2_745348 [Rhizophagus irregularis]GBC36508.1 hypothetical protein RIR_e36600_A0A2N1NAU7_9GLOM [Rhizophagus irregularis DAOM 181602=DAOM 197198]
MNRFIFVLVILLITLVALPNSEAYPNPGGFCCKTFDEEGPTSTSEVKAYPTI